MTDQMPEKVQTLFDSRLKIKTELKYFQNDIIDAVNNSERRVCVERLVTFCNKAITKTCAKNQQLFERAKETSDPTFTPNDLAKWSNDATVKNDTTLQKARENFIQFP